MSSKPTPERFRPAYDRIEYEIVEITPGNEQGMSKPAVLEYVGWDSPNGEDLKSALHTDDFFGIDPFIDTTDSGFYFTGQFYIPDERLYFTIRADATTIRVFRGDEPLSYERFCDILLTVENDLGVELVVAETDD